MSLTLCGKCGMSFSDEVYEAHCNACPGTFGGPSRSASKPCAEIAIAEREALALERIATALEDLADRADNISDAIYSSAKDVLRESQDARGINRHD